MEEWQRSLSRHQIELDEYRSIIDVVVDQYDWPPTISQFIHIAYELREREKANDPNRDLYRVFYHLDWVQSRLDEIIKKEQETGSLIDPEDRKLQLKLQFEMRDPND